MPKLFECVVGISDDKTGVRLEPGDVVPAELLKRAAWLVEQGAVVEQIPGGE